MASPPALQVQPQLPHLAWPTFSNSLPRIVSSIIMPGLEFFVGDAVSLTFKVVDPDGDPVKVGGWRGGGVWSFSWVTRSA